MERKNKIIIYVSILLFGAIGVYLTFFAGNVDKYDSQTKAYRIDPNENYDIDDGTTYNPIYYFKVDGREYQCYSKGGSSSYPNESKNIVYYDSSNPTKCLTESDKSSSKILGIICLVATAVIIYFFVIKKPSDNIVNYNQTEGIDYEKQQQIEENASKVLNVIGKVQLIYKRVILGIIILILFVLIMIDTSIFKQTIKAKDYIDTTATYVDKKTDGEDNIFDDYIYTFKDKKGNQQEIIVSVSKDESPENEINIKYDENNPQDYYKEGMTLDKSGMIWYIIKIVALVLLIILFFNKKILNKINISAGSN